VVNHRQEESRLLKAPDAWSAPIHTPSTSHSASYPVFFFFFLSSLSTSSTLLWIVKTEVHFAASAVCSSNTAAHPTLFIQRILSFYIFSLRLSSM
jgi:hypothetical protein